MMFRYEMHKIREKVLIWIAWKLPRRVAYWATVRVATAGYEGNPAERPIVESLSNWGVAE